MSLAFNTRTTGMMPLEIVSSPELTTAIADEGFVDGKMWHRKSHDRKFIGPPLCHHADKLSLLRRQCTRNLISGPAPWEKPKTGNSLRSRWSYLLVGSRPSTCST